MGLETSGGGTCRKECAAIAAGWPCCWLAVPCAVLLRPAASCDVLQATP